MNNSKENDSYYECADYIRYLYQEGVRSGVHKDPQFYPEILKFVKSPEGREAYKKFLAIGASRFGIQKKSENNSYTRTFKL